MIVFNCVFSLSRVPNRLQSARVGSLLMQAPGTRDASAVHREAAFMLNSIDLAPGVCLWLSYFASLYLFEEISRVLRYGIESD